MISHSFIDCLDSYDAVRTACEQPGASDKLDYDLHPERHMLIRERAVSSPEKWW